MRSSHPSSAQRHAPACDRTSCGHGSPAYPDSVRRAADTLLASIHVESAETGAAARRASCRSSGTAMRREGRPCSTDRKRRASRATRSDTPAGRSAPTSLKSARYAANAICWRRSSFRARASRAATNPRSYRPNPGSCTAACCGRRTGRGRAVDRGRSGHADSTERHRRRAARRGLAHAAGVR